MARLIGGRPTRGSGPPRKGRSLWIAWGRGMGEVITFYSYVGGVGRSMALANTATLLARWGYRTLMIDWDLKAPALENYFRTYISNFKSVGEKEGVIDL